MYKNGIFLPIYHKNGIFLPIYHLLERLKKIYSQRMEIKTMFKDYKTGGYNLESLKANETRLNNLILLIAISYTLRSFQVQKNKNKGVQ